MKNAQSAYWLNLEMHGSCVLGIQITWDKFLVEATVKGYPNQFGSQILDQHNSSYAQNSNSD